MITYEIETNFDGRNSMESQYGTPFSKLMLVTIRNAQPI